MVEDIERAQDRLENVHTVEPLLGALRTISLASWQAALRQKENVQKYTRQLTMMLPFLLPHIPAPQKKRGARPTAQATKIVALAIGSERGLCGRFNAEVHDRTIQYMDEQTKKEVQVELYSLGHRLNRIFQREQRALAWTGTLSGASLPSYRLAFDLTRRWLIRYEARELDNVDIIYNSYRGAGRYEAVVIKLIPPQLSFEEQSSSDEIWPSPIIETEPLSLYTRVVEQGTAIRLYECLLNSAAAEHSARYQLMEEATKNAERLINELTMAVQMARRQAITQEMQELAAGAGLLGAK